MSVHDKDCPRCKDPEVICECGWPGEDKRPPIPCVVNRCQCEYCKRERGEQPDVFDIIASIRKDYEGTLRGLAQTEQWTEDLVEDVEEYEGKGYRKFSDDRYRETYQAIRMMWAQHIKKGTDYGDKEDILANLTACEELGIAPWVGTTIRMKDKEKRISAHLNGHTLVNDSVFDDVFDNAVYGMLRLALFLRDNPQYKDEKRDEKPKETGVRVYLDGGTTKRVGGDGGTSDVPIRNDPDSGSGEFLGANKDLAPR